MSTVNQEEQKVPMPWHVEAKILWGRRQGEANEGSRRQAGHTHQTRNEGQSAKAPGHGVKRPGMVSCSKSEEELSQELFDAAIKKSCVANLELQYPYDIRVLMTFVLWGTKKD